MPQTPNFLVQWLATSQEAASFYINHAPFGLFYFKADEISNSQADSKLFHSLGMGEAQNSFDLSQFLDTTSQEKIKQISKTLKDSHVNEHAFALMWNINGNKYQTSCSAYWQQSEEMVLVGISTLEEVSSKQLNNYFNFIAETAAEGVMVFENNHLVYASPAMSAFLEGPLANLIGKHVDVFFEDIHPDESAHVLKIYDDILINKTSKTQYRFRYKNPSGKYVWREDQASFVFNEQGDIEKSVVVTRDVTHQIDLEKELVKQEAIYRETFDNVQIGLLIADHETTMLEINDAACSIIGLPREVLIGGKINDPNWVLFDEKFNEFTIEERPVCITAATGEAVSPLTMGFYKHDEPEKVKWVELSSSPLFNEDGEVDKIVCTFLDVTERHEVENQLKLEKKRLDNVVNGTKLGTWEWNLAKNYYEFNTHWAEMLGYRIEEVSFGSIEKWQNQAHPDDLKKIEEAIEAHIMNKTENYSVEFRIKHKLGHWVWILARGKVITWDSEGNPVLFAGTHNDISKRKEAENQLQIEKRRIDNIIDGVKLGTWEWNMKENSAEFNTHWAEMIGYSSEEVTPGNFKLFNSLLHPEDIAKMEKSIKAYINKETDSYFIEFRMKHKKGHWVWIESRGKVLSWDNENNPLLFSGTHTDISERKEAENQLQIEKRRLENIVDGVKLGTWEWNIDTDLLEYNSHYSELLGYAVDEISPNTLGNWRSMIHSDDLPKVKKAFDAHLKGETDIYEQEFRMQHKKGHWIWVLGMGKVISTDSNGLPTLIAGTRIDISARKKQEGELRLFESVIKNTKDAVLITEAEPFDLPGPKIVFVNEAFCKMTGYDSEELIGKTPRILQGAKSDRKILDKVKESQKKWESFEYDLINYKKSGEEFWVNMSVTPLTDETGTYTHWIAVERDITEQKQQVEELRLFESVIKNTKDAVLITEAEPFDLPGPKIVFVNEAFYKMTGYAPDELIGKTPRVLQGPNSDRKKLDEIRKSLQNWEAFETEIINYKKNGEAFWINLSITPLADETGYFTHWIAVERDITEQKHQVEELRLFESVIKNTNDSVIIYDVKKELASLPTLEVSFVNEALLTLTGYTNEELLGQAPDVVHGPLTDTDTVSKIAQSIQQIQAFEHELLVYKKNGDPFWVNISVSPLLDEDGDCTHWIGIIRDISQRKAQEKALRQAKEKALENSTKLLNLFHAMEDIVFEMDYNGTYLYVAPTQNRYLVESSESIVGKTLHDTFPKEQADIFLSFIRESLDEQKSNKIVYPLHIDDKLLWFEGKSTPTGDKKALYIATDITESKKAEAMLIASEKQYRQLVENTNDIIFSVSSEGIFTFVSPAWQRLLGHTDEEVVGHSFTKFVHPDDISICATFLQKVLDTGKLQEEIIEYRVKHKNGHWLWHASNGGPQKDSTGNVIGFDGLARDITERKQAEESLVASEEKYRTMFNSSYDAISILDLETGKFIDCNESAIKLHDTGSKENFLDKLPSDLSPKHQPNGELSEDLAISHIQKAFKQGGHGFEWAHCKADGTTFPVYVTLTPLVYGNQQLVLAHGRDISELKEKEQQIKKAKEKVEESEQRLKMAATASQLGIWDWDIKTNKIVWDERSYELYGWKKGEVEPSFEIWSKSVHPDDLERMLNELDEVLKGNRQHNTNFRVVHPDGKVLFLNGYGSVLRDAGGKPIRMIGVDRDVTEAKLKEIEIVQAKEKAEAASLAKSDFLANMSHEIRTPLNSVIGFSELLMQTKLDNSQKEYMQSVNYSANSLLDLINDVLDFSKIEAGKLELENTKTDVYELIYQIAEMIKFKLNEKGLELLLDIAPNTPKYIFIDAIRVRQILVNLLGNAAKFTENGEVEIAIKTLVEVNDASKTSLRFAVRDTGIGISEDKQKSIFDAFAQEDTSTTRKYGGTGLGLSISNKLLALMDSALQLNSEQGKGSTFYFDIEVECETEQVFDETTLDGIDTILLVDDNSRSQEIIENIFLESQINIEIANNGFDALGNILTNWQRYDAVLLDYNMPIVDGKEVVKQVKEKLQLNKQQLPILMMHDGLSEEECQQLAVEYPIFAFLQKPLIKSEIYKLLASINKDTNENPTSTNLNVNQAGKAHFHGKSVLIVDDNPINRKLAKSMIHKLHADVEIVEAEDGNKALELVLQQDFCLIFMDVQMPGMSGYETTQQIRIQQSEKTRTTIIALTAGTVKGERERCLAAGMDDYMSKPVNLDKFKSMIKKWTTIDEEDNASIIQEITKNTRLDFNYRALLAQFADDSEIVETVLDMIRQGELKSFILKLNELITQLDKVDDIQRTAHTIKGIGLNLHFEKLADLAAQLENKNPDYNNEHTKALVSQIDMAYQIIEKQILEKEYLKPIKS